MNWGLDEGKILVNFIFLHILTAPSSGPGPQETFNKCL